jgi:hypothetical protein
MRDDVGPTASANEKMAAIQQNIAISQRYLDRVTPDPDPILQLPLAVYRYVRHRPDCPDGVKVCAALLPDLRKIRREVAIDRQSYCAPK